MASALRMGLTARVGGATGPGRGPARRPAGRSPPSFARRPSSIAPHASATGGGGGGVIGGDGRGWSGGGGGGGGGGGDDGAPSDGGDSGKKLGAAGLAGLLARWPGWQARTAADPSFAYKVALEQIIGVGAAVVGDMASRPGWGLKELDFVFATLVVGSILNFSLMYLLAPVAAAAGAASVASRSGLGAAVSALFSPSTLTKLGAPAGHAFEPGFSLAARATNLLVKGGLFAGVGFGAGVVGTTLSNALLWLRQRADPTFELQNTPPGVLANAGAWAAHMGVSSNLRYQAINGLDAALQPVMPPALFRAYSVALRTANNVLGGMSFVFLAKLLGVQKAADGEGAKAVPAAKNTKTAAPAVDKKKQQAKAVAAQGKKAAGKGKAAVEEGWAGFWRRPKVA